MLQEYKYFLDHGDLVVQENTSKSVIWRGRPKGIEIDTFYTIPSSHDCIVLLNWNKGIKENILRININGEILWKVIRPKETMFSVNRLNDIYVSVEKLLSEKIYGNSWYRFRDAIKLNNGEVVETVFTK